jgi:hypothetical protein
MRDRNWVMVPSVPKTVEGRTKKRPTRETSAEKYFVPPQKSVTKGHFRIFEFVPTLLLFRRPSAIASLIKSITISLQRVGVTDQLKLILLKICVQKSLAVIAENRLGRAVGCTLKAPYKESRKKTDAQTGRREAGTPAV